MLEINVTSLQEGNNKKIKIDMFVMGAQRSDTFHFNPERKDDRKQSPVKKIPVD